MAVNSDCCSLNLTGDYTMSEAAQESARTRAEVSKRSFLNKDGGYTARATADTIGFKIELVESGDSFTHKLSEFTPGVLAAAAAFGLVTSVTNTIGGKSLSGDERAALLQDRLDTLLEGDWSAERQSGPRSSQLLEAIVQVRANAGKDSTQEWRDKVSTSLKTDPELAKKYLANPLVAAEYANIKAKAAVERAQKLQAQAKTAVAASDDLVLED